MVLERKAGELDRMNGNNDWVRSARITLVELWKMCTSPSNRLDTIAHARPLPLIAITCTFHRGISRLKAWRPRDPFRTSPPFLRKTLAIYMYHNEREHSTNLISTKITSCQNDKITMLGNHNHAIRYWFLRRIVLGGSYLQAPGFKGLKFKREHSGSLFNQEVLSGTILQQWGINMALKGKLPRPKKVSYRIGISRIDV